MMPLFSLSFFWVINQYLPSNFEATFSSFAIIKLNISPSSFLSTSIELKGSCKSHPGAPQLKFHFIRNVVLAEND